MLAAANTASHTSLQQSDEAVVDHFFAEVVGLAKAARDFSFDLYRPEGVPLGVAAVLQSLLEHGPQTVPRIGRGRLTSRQNTQILVNRMLRAGWVELAPNPSHKRSSLVQLTESGMRLARAVTAREAELSRVVSPAVSAEDLERATALLARIRELVSGGQSENSVATVSKVSRRPNDRPEVKETAVAREIPPKPSFPSITDENELPVSLL